VTFDLLTLAVSDELRAWHIKHTYKFLAPYDYPFLSYVWLSWITLPSPGTVTAHAPCHVTYHRGQKWSTFLKSLTPNLPIHFITSKELRRRLICYMRKIAFSHCEGYKVHCACAVSRDLFIGGPPKPHVTIFWPRIVYSLYNFYGATMTIKGSLYWSISTLKSSQIGSKNGGFSEI